MYIIETFRGEVRIDKDELTKLRDNMDKQLIFFRQGAVNPKQIVRVIEDSERKKDVLKLAGETPIEYEQRILEDISHDIFSDIRQDTLPEGNNIKRLT